MPSALDRTRRNWERFGETDPMWGVLAFPGMRGRWQADDFYRHGQTEVKSLLTQLEMAGVKPDGHRVLDFGCGIGRLSFALADHFEHVVGVDISRPMVEQARRYNPVGDRCEFHLYDGKDLGLLADDSFSTVVSLMTLQHVPPASAMAYLPELVRVLRPGGVLAVQIPSERARSTVPAWLRLRRGARVWAYRAVRHPPRMDMYAIPVVEVSTALEAAGADVAGVIPDGRAGTWGTSVLYVAVRRGPARGLEGPAGAAGPAGAGAPGPVASGD